MTCFIELTNTNCIAVPVRRSAHIQLEFWISWKRNSLTHSLTAQQNEKAQKRKNYGQDCHSRSRLYWVEIPTSTVRVISLSSSSCRPVMNALEACRRRHANQAVKWVDILHNDLFKCVCVCMYTSNAIMCLSLCMRAQWGSLSIWDPIFGPTLLYWLEGSKWHSLCALYYTF